MNLADDSKNSTYNLGKPKMNATYVVPSTSFKTIRQTIDLSDLSSDDEKIYEISSDSDSSVIIKKRTGELKISSESEEEEKLIEEVLSEAENVIHEIFSDTEDDAIEILSESIVKPTYTGVVNESTVSGEKLSVSYESPKSFDSSPIQSSTQRKDFIENKKEMLPKASEFGNLSKQWSKSPEVIELLEDRPNPVILIEDDDPIENEVVEVSSIQQNRPLKIISNKAKKPLLIPPPSLNPEIYIQMSDKKLFGGKMTEKRMETVKAITGEMISAMHNSINSVPENTLTDSPRGLRIELMRHQKVGLTWLLWREQQVPPSGILADDMGLGKTLSMISLILEKKNRRLAAKNTEDDARETLLQRRASQGSKLQDSNATLLIAPASLIYQWEKEVKDRVKNELLSVYVFHGPKRQRDCDVARLARYDLVLTTYQTVASELSEKKTLGLNIEESSDEDITSSPFSKKRRHGDKKVVSKSSRSVLSKILWERVILDEAHQIKNRNSLGSRACCRLASVHRWCLTGTPIHNELWDLFSLIRFLRVTPFSEEKTWKEFIMINSKNNAERLNTLIKGLLLRRTKTQICNVTNKPLIELKLRKYEVVTLELQKLERRCYDIMFAASKQKVRDLLKNQESVLYGIVPRRHKNNPAEIVKNPFVGGSREINLNDRFQQMSSVLVLLLRLRQACVHMSLTRSGIDLEAFKDAGGDIDECNAEIVCGKTLNVLEQSFANLSLDQELLVNQEDEEDDSNENNFCVGGKRNEKIETIFEPTYSSTKINAVIERLDDVIKVKDKCVIVSQWTAMLSIVEHHLKLEKICYTSITGAVPTKDRQERVDSFNQEKGGAQVMLLSLTAGGVGLNLIGGNHLFLLDLHWNPALEQQACDRIYRMGQRKNVFIHKFLCDKTIEKRVLELQEKKTALATSVLEGASKKLNKLSVNDLKFLFELDNRAPTAVSSSVG